MALVGRGLEGGVGGCFLHGKRGGGGGDLVGGGGGGGKNWEREANKGGIERASKQEALRKVVVGSRLKRPLTVSSPIHSTVLLVDQTGNIFSEREGVSVRARLH